MQQNKTSVLKQVLFFFLEEMINIKTIQLTQQTRDYLVLFSSAPLSTHLFLALMIPGLSSVIILSTYLAHLNSIHYLLVN